MHSRLLEEATHEQLKSFLYEQFAELKRTNPEIYQEMECDLYESIHGPHFTDWKYEWAVKDLENEDGTKGPHWSAQDIAMLAKQKGVSFERFNEYDLAFAMNMAYSDYYGAVPDTVDSYFKIAKAFLEDKDAPEGKAFLYHKAMR